MKPRKLRLLDAYGKEVRAMQWAEGHGSPPDIVCDVQDDGRRVAYRLHEVQKKPAQQLDYVIARALWLTPNKDCTEVVGAELQVANLRQTDSD